MKVTINERFEGGWDSKFTQLMRQLGYNLDTNIELGTVTSAPPTIRVKIDGMKTEIETDELVVAEHLTNHRISAKINGAQNTIEFENVLKVGDRVIIASANKGQRYYVIDKAVSY